MPLNLKRRVKMIDEVQQYEYHRLVRKIFKRNGLGMEVRGGRGVGRGEWGWGRGGGGGGGCQKSREVTGCMKQVKQKVLL